MELKISKKDIKQYMVKKILDNYKYKYYSGKNNKINCLFILC